MRWAGLARRTPIGLDLGRCRLKAAQLVRGRRGWRLAAAADVPRPQPHQPLDPAQVRALCDVLHRQGFVGQDAVLGVPPDKLISGILDVPSAARGVPVDQIARMELARIHKCSPESFEMAHWEVPAPGPARPAGRVMAAACAHAEAEPLLDACEFGGLSVRALDVQACAIARACAPALAPAPAITCVLDMGWTAARLLVFFLGTVVYQRTLGDAGVSALFGALKRQLELDPEATDSLLAEIGLAEEADRQGAVETFDDLRGILASHLDSMAKELRISFSYALHQYADAPLERMLLIGGGAVIPGVAKRLASALDLDVRVAGPDQVVDCPPPLKGMGAGPALTVSVGLAQFAGT